VYVTFSLIDPAQETIFRTIERGAASSDIHPFLPLTYLSFD